MNFGALLDSLFAAPGEDDDQHQRQQKQQPQKQESESHEDMSVSANSVGDKPSVSSGDASQEAGGNEEEEEEDPLAVLSRGFWSTLGAVQSTGQSFVEAVKDDLNEFRSSLASETKSLLVEKKRELREKELRRLAASSVTNEPPAIVAATTKQEQEQHSQPLEAADSLLDSLWNSTLTALPELFGLDLDENESASPASVSSQSSSGSARSPLADSQQLQRQQQQQQRSLHQTSEQLGLLLRVLGYQQAPSSTFCLRFHEMHLQQQSYTPPRPPTDDKEFLQLIENHESEWLVFLRSPVEPITDPEEAPGGHDPFVSRVLSLSRGHYLGLFPALRQLLAASQGRSGFRESVFWMAFVFRLFALWTQEQLRMRVLASAGSPLPASRDSESGSVGFSNPSSSGDERADHLPRTPATVPRTPVSKLTSWSDDDDEDGDEDFEMVAPSPASRFITPGAATVSGVASSAPSPTPSASLNLSWSESDEDE